MGEIAEGRGGHSSEEIANLGQDLMLSTGEQPRLGLRDGANLLSGAISCDWNFGYLNIFSFGKPGEERLDLVRAGGE